ncbi:dihydrodipicolinate reductase [Frankia sp. CNm7]|uniref:Dihydrodipicolinate reductase n=1 Tax=Frankia nepalensis TaxID=1836974 RepID=A0A937UPW2_9ACTN|nr:dihydrodipicolinate reductase [Frankia nepalensis]MBL7501080.1 dihydrodipicolinate reductase [Frankia nepalensis]MBL7514717.1 dihydrodipicolinate reductase [Frankia nepalensis]MBL7524568.1 dihydrodipicolinate reductase [Frankia nepalensis]MBL7631274.1 dihydrodipicolinate reductase [Frankia nepalensis]
MTYRVVQWTTGNVGRQSVEAILAHPDLELVGCYAWSPDKAGKDVGELCGTSPAGVAATNDVDALLALKPDCVVYNPMWLDVAEMVRILESGANIVSTAGFITGHSLGDGRDRILEACARGQSSVFGSGINPGLANLIAMVSAAGCDRVDKIVVSETADATGYDSPATELPVGFARPIDDPDLLAMTTKGTSVFEDAVRLLGSALGVEFDEIVCEAEYAKTTEDLDLGSWKIAAGCVAGIAGSWQGRIAGRTVVDLRFRWRKGQSLEPDWKMDTGYFIEVQGRPTIRTKVEILPPADFQGSTLSDFMVLGMVMTAMPAVHAIPAVVAAPPGIVTYTDLPLPLPRKVVPRPAEPELVG